MKDLFDTQTEETGGAEGKWKTRIELAGLDGVDRLPGYIQGYSQLGLRPVALSAQYLQPVLHRYRHVPYTKVTINVTPMSNSRSQISGWKEIRW